MIEDYIMSRIGKAERSSLNRSLSALDLFFSMNDITLNFKKIKKLVPKQEYKLSGMRAYTVDEIRELIEFCKTYVHQVLIYVMASSGVRVGFVEGLRIKHLRDMPMGCKAITVYADTVYEYTTFMTPEASRKLELYFDWRRKKAVCTECYREFPILTNWHDKSADCPYCLAEFDEFDEYDD